MRFSKLSVIVLLAFSIMSCAGSQKDESTGEFFDSAAITTKVKAKILQVKKLSALKISVVTYKNKVQLSGFVNSQKEKELAQDVTLSVEGVESVTNSIIVK